MRWLDLATDRIIDFKTSQRVRREVLDILDACSISITSVAGTPNASQRKPNGTPPRQRAPTGVNGMRVARRHTRPIHVEVEPSAWAAMKLDTIRRRSTVGETVGVLVQAEVERQRQAHGETDGETPAPWSDRRGQPGMGRRAKVFARIVVSDETWADFKAFAAEAGITVARAVGLLVDNHRG